MPLRYDGSCKVCGAEVPAGTTAFYDYDARTVTCSTTACAAADGLTEQKWSGSPVSGSWVEVIAEHRIGQPHRATGARARVVSTRFSSGAVVYQNANGRCIDAPCCGCCS